MTAHVVLYNRAAAQSTPPFPQLVRSFPHHLVSLTFSPAISIAITKHQEVEKTTEHWTVNLQEFQTYCQISTITTSPEDTIDSARIDAMEAFIFFAMLTMFFVKGTALSACIIYAWSPYT